MKSMKITILRTKLIVFLLLIKILCNAQVTNKKTLSLHTYRTKQAIILKEYFLCNCIQFGFEKGNLDLSKVDHSIQFYEEELWAKIDKMDRLKISEYAKAKALAFKISPLSEKYGISGLCINLFNSDSLNLIVKKIVKKNIIEVPKI
jgi:hypothetical protein